MKDFFNSIVLILSILLLPVFIIIWVIWGFFHGISVWSWNVLNNPCGEWKFNKPSQDVERKNEA